MQHQKNLIVEKLSHKATDLATYNFSIPHNYIIYFEKEDNPALNIYIRKNHDDLKTKFLKLGYNFMFLPFLVTGVMGIDQLLEYYVPQLSNFDILDKVKSDYAMAIIGNSLYKGIEDAWELSNEKEYNPLSYNYNAILEWLQYKGKMNSGFLLFGYPESTISVADHFYNQNTKGDFRLFFEEFESYLIEANELDVFDFSTGDAMLTASHNIADLDDETKRIIEEFEIKLSELKDSGQLLLVVPILKEILNQQTQKIDLENVSTLEINEQNKIWLPYFKKEVEMSHLTKSIYFLFLKYPEGISLKELQGYKKELFEIYKAVSNQLNHDKMVKSVEDVLDLETKSIYTHLSRIKSSYYKIMDQSYAYNYIVSGSGEQNRKVLLSPKSVHWNSYGSIEDYEL